MRTSRLILAAVLATLAHAGPSEAATRYLYLSDQQVVPRMVIDGPAFGTADATTGAIAPTTFHVSGGVPPYTWRMSNGPGLSLSASGDAATVSGSVTVGETAQVTASDSAGNSALLTLSVTRAGAAGTNPAGGGSPPSGSLIVSSEMDSVTSYGTPISLPPPNVAGNPVGIVTWSLSGSLPPGTVLDAANGRITGTPTQTGNWSLRLTVTDSAGRTATTNTFLIGVHS